MRNPTIFLFIFTVTSFNLVGFSQERSSGPSSSTRSPLEEARVREIINDELVNEAEERLIRQQNFARLEAILKRLKSKSQTHTPTPSAQAQRHGNDKPLDVVVKKEPAHSAKTTDDPVLTIVDELLDRISKLEIQVKALHRKVELIEAPSR
jgi:hypothetical protein